MPQVRKGQSVLQNLQMVILYKDFSALRALTLPIFRMNWRLTLGVV